MEMSENQSTGILTIAPKKQRNSTIELLRIICMLIIVAHHFVVHGGAMEIESGANRILAYLLIPGGKIAFCCFIAISTWFLCESQFQTKRFLKIYLETLFYSVLLTVLAVALGKNIDFKTAISVWFVIAGNSHGFAAAYLLFYLFLPFLHKITKNITKKQLIVLTVLLFYAQILSQNLGIFFNYRQSFASELLLFVLFYFTSLTLKRYPPNFISRKWLLGIIFVISWILCYALYITSSKNNNSTIQYFLDIFRDESSILNIAAGYSLFLFFKDFQLKPNKLVNRIASCTFGVLLIHDHNILRNVFWSKIFPVRVCFAFPFYQFALCLIGFVLAIFIVCALFDYFRQVALEKPLFNLEKLNVFCDRIDRWLNEEKGSNCQ